MYLQGNKHSRGKSTWESGGAFTNLADTFIKSSSTCDLQISVTHFPKGWWAFALYLWSWLTSRRHVLFRPNTFFSGVNPAGCCTSELNRIWQTLQEMTGRLVLISGTPKVWFMTAFCTGSICWGNDSGRGEIR